MIEKKKYFLTAQFLDRFFLLLDLYLKHLSVKAGFSYLCGVIVFNGKESRDQTQVTVC